MIAILRRFLCGKKSFLKEPLRFLKIKEERKKTAGKRKKSNFISKSANYRSSWPGLKKNLLSFDRDERYSLLELDSIEISITQQCLLLGISRSSVYYDKKPISDENKLLMNLIDEQYTKTPFYGRRRMTAWLRSEVDFEVNPKRVAGLMKDLGLQAIYPKPNTSKANKSHEKYPYLLKDYPIVRPGQVYSTDITYVRLDGGFAYLCAVIDWHSRYVLSWRLSNTLDTDFCLEALEESLRKGVPEIFNTDQGCQFTSKEFTGVLKRAGVFISMDGRGRALDNIFVERLWRSVKYENIYPMNYRTMQQARNGLEEYFKFYNNQRFHQSLGYRTPQFVHFQEGEKEGSQESLKMELDLIENRVLLS